MNKTMKRLGAGAVVAALALAGVAASGAAAFAAGGEFTNPYTFQLLNATGSPITTGSLTSTTIQGIQINATCGSTASDAQAFFGLYKADGTLVSSQGQLINKADDGVYGINGLTTSDTQVLMKNTNGGTPYIAQQSFTDYLALTGLPAITNGSYQFRYICYNQAGGASAGGADAAANFFQVPITIAGTTWTVTPAAVQPVNTSTSLSGVLNSDKSVTYTATVTPASGTATPSGTVAVTSGANTLCTITLPATTCNTAVLADGSYSAIATYSGDTAFNGSVSSTFGPIFVGAIGKATGQIQVNIPAQGNTGLTLTGTPSATITAAHTSGNRFTGNANTGVVKVIDERQTGAPTWTLSGSLSTLTKGTDSISATDLGWKPFFVNTPGAANATLGASFNPTNGGGTGFAGAKTLATGDVPVNSSATETDAYAQLLLDTAGNKPAGQYNGTLTITLTAP